MATCELTIFLDEAHIAPERKQERDCSRFVFVQRGIQLAVLSAAVLLVCVVCLSSYGRITAGRVAAQRSWRSLFFANTLAEIEAEDYYIPGIDGMNRCGVGSVPLSEDECRDMPHHFGGELHDPLVVVSSGDPRGCFRFWKWYYFNSHPHGSAKKDRTPYCRVTAATIAQGNLSQNTTSGDPATDSLFCFALAASIDEEMPLLQFQYREKASLFACDSQAIYSQELFELAPGINTTGIGVNTTCQMGGPFWTCLNSWIFIEVWKNVISDGRFKLHDWTVKLDPDAVFFPRRAIAALRGVADPQNGVYIINCKQGAGYGLHGPTEVFSRNAVQTYADGWEQCVKGPHRLHFGLWGEDFFIDECLKKLGVSRREDGNFLSEPHCDAPGTSGTFKGKGNDAWKSCENAQYVAFHPFKTESKYRDCLTNAGNA